LKNTDIINRADIIGNVTRDPEMRTTTAGQNVLTLGVATNMRWRSKTTGETQERTEWHRVVFFNRLAEIAGEYLKKGSKVYVEGSLRTRKWQDQSGADKYTTEIVASEMQMLDARGDDQQQQPQQQAPQQQPQQAQQPQQPSQQTQQPAQQQPRQVAPSPASSEFEDDIPF